MRNYRDLSKQLSRLQGMTQRLATKVPNLTGDEAKVVQAILDKADELEALLNTQVIRHLSYTQDRKGSKETAGQTKGYEHEPEPAIEQVPIT